MESAMNIWNEVVRDGIAFPQDEELTEQNADSFFNSQDEQRCRTTSFWTTAAMWISIQSFRSISVGLAHDKASNDVPGSVVGHLPNQVAKIVG